MAFNTTGFTGFAECRLHSAKASLHSANSLPSVTLGKRHSAKPPTAKGSLPSVGFRALGKDFVESLDTRHRSHVAGPWHSAKRPPRVPPRGRFAECWVWHSANFQIFAECLTAGTRQNGRAGSLHVVSLPSAGSWHSANFQIFAECQDFSTQQSGCSADM